MKLLFVALAIVATASAAVIQNPPHNPDNAKRNLQGIVAEVQTLINSVSTILNGKRSLLTIAQELQGVIDSVTQAFNSGKREQDFDLVSLANTATQVIHALDVAINGQTAKRSLQTIATEIQALIDNVSQIFSGGAKRSLLTIAQELQGVIDSVTQAFNSGKRDQDFDLVSLANTAAQLIHAIDVAFNAATKRSLQSIATEIQALIDNVSQIFSGGAKRSLLTIAQELQGLIDSVTQAASSGKRDQDFDLVSLANTATQVIHAIDVAINGGTAKRSLQSIASEIQTLIDNVSQIFSGGAKRSLLTIAQELQGVIDSVTQAFNSGKREQDFDLVSLANTATQVIHALDVAINGGTAKRSLQSIATEIQALIDNVSQIFSGGAKRSLLTIAQELQGLIDSVTQAVSSGKRDQDFDLVSLANTATQVIHALDVAINGQTGKRSLQTIATEIQALIDNVSQIFSGGAKRSLLTIAQELQGVIDSVTQAFNSGKREQDFDLVSFANTATQVIHALDVALNGKRSLQTIATEIQALIDNVSQIFSGGAKRSLVTIAQELQGLIDSVTQAVSSGKRDQDFDLVSLANTATQVIHALDVAINGQTGKRSLQTIATEIQALIDNVSQIFSGGAKRSLLTIAQEIQSLIDGVSQAVQSG